MKRALYILGCLLIVAAIFQLFFRYQYLKSGYEWYRIDRLTGQTCTMPCHPFLDWNGSTREDTTVQTPSATDGKLVFAQNCASCHGSTGIEGGVGPSLRGERKRKTLDELIAWIKDPTPPMPRLYPATLSEQDVRNVAAYVESL